MMTCPLCLEAGPKRTVRGADRRTYLLCETCRLIFADSSQHPGAKEERARYETHLNCIDDEGYVRHLRRLLDPLLPYLHPGMRGVDFGCGPGPALSKLIRRHGIRCEEYDPFFLPRTLCPPYDFIVSTECFEHFHRPAETIERVVRMLTPGGLLGVMTEQWVTVEQFGEWYYTRDPTHVSFFHADTFDYLCRVHALETLYRAEDRVIVLRRQEEERSGGEATEGGHSAVQPDPPPASEAAGGRRQTRRASRRCA